MSGATLPMVPRSLHPYLNDIAERLFSRHAAIMIGSGFSKNAKPHSPTSPVFPDWYELGDLFYEKLNNEKPDAHSRYIGIPALAHEVEAAVGRPALNQLLRSAIPDRHHEPSQLHKDLLTLPWEDVYTTNYDTLLERACESLASQRYDVVPSQESLTYSEKPRIIKLHGSLDCEETLVITDEDYRRYPDDSAAFVNTVRQTLLENTLCLIGFSGQDPNFLQWVGWLHDNLGLSNSPKMYLVGSAMSPTTQAKLLEIRNIISVDMSEYPDIRSGDHEQSIQRFVDYLQSRRGDFDRLGWPDAEYDGGPERDKDIAAEVRRILPRWTKQRKMYPGWVVVPADRRRALWEGTRNWIGETPNVENTDGGLCLRFAFELLWRMEKCLYPISDNQIQFLEATMKRSLGSDDYDVGSDGRPKDAETGVEYGFERETIHLCDYVLLSMMRYYREEGLSEKWRECDQTLSQHIGTLSREHAARLHYERSLSSLFELNTTQVREVIDGWPVDDSLPFWEAKRASLLAELGRLGDTVRILEKSLATIRARSNLKPVTTDYSSVSQEAVVMIVLRSARRALDMDAGKFGAEDKRGKEFTERWESLAKFKCDPWGELELFKSVLEREPRYTPYLAERPGFDVGMVTRTHYPMTRDHEAVAAYNFLRFCEEVGMPFRVGSCHIATTSAAGTLSRIAVYSPHFANVTLIRIGDEKVVDSVFNRVAIVGWDSSHVDGLVERYLRALEGIGPEVRSSPRWARSMALSSAMVIPEILSRLCCRCSRKTKDEMLAFLRGIYESSDKAKYGGIRNLTKRLLTACAMDHRVALIPKLLEFPMLDELDPLARLEYPNPFEYLDVRGELGGRGVRVGADLITGLVRNVKSGNHEARQWAALTLSVLDERGLLSKTNATRFAQSLWSRVDQDGFPADTWFSRADFLRLPRSDKDPVKLFREWVARRSFPIERGAERIPLDQPIELCDEIVGGSRHLKWSEDEVASAVERIGAWWDSDKQYLKVSRELLAKEFRRRFSILVDTLTAVITPAYSEDGDGLVGEVVKRLVRELSQAELCVVRLECACLHLFPESWDRVISTIEEKSTSTSEDVVGDVITGVRLMARQVGVGETEGEIGRRFARALAAVGQLIRLRSDAGLVGAMNLMVDVIRTHAWVFGGRLEKDVLEGLRQLVDDTTIRATGNPLVESRMDPWDTAKNIVLRRGAAGLAYALSEHYSQRSEVPPDAIGRWARVCDSDWEFAEIRNAWTSSRGV